MKDMGGTTRSAGVTSVVTSPFFSFSSFSSTGSWDFLREKKPLLELSRCAVVPFSLLMVTFSSVVLALESDMTGRVVVRRIK